MTASESSQGLLGGESCTESGAWKLGLRKSVYPEHREHIQAEPGRTFRLSQDAHSGSTFRLSQWPGCRASTEQGGSFGTTGPWLPSPSMPSGGHVESQKEFCSFYRLTHDE